MWLDKVFAEVHVYLTNSYHSDVHIGVIFTDDVRDPVWLSYRYTVSQKDRET